MITENNVMDYAVARTNADKRVVTMGQIIAYSGAPMVCIQDSNGDKMWWRADLCQIVPPISETASWVEGIEPQPNPPSRLT